MRLLAWNIRHGGGRRLPSIFDALAGLRAVRYSHEERLRGVSDHSAIMMDFMPNEAGQHRRLTLPGEPARPRAVDLPAAFSVPVRRTSL